MARMLVAERRSERQRARVGEVRIEVSVGEARMNYEFWRRPDHPQVAGRDREDEAEREDGPPGSEPLENAGGRRRYDDGPGEGRGETDRGTRGRAGVQGILRLSLCAVHFDQ